MDELSRAFGHLEGKIDGILEAIERFTRRQEAADAAVSTNGRRLDDHETRIVTLEESKAEFIKEREKVSQRKLTRHDTILLAAWTVGLSGLVGGLAWLVENVLLHGGH